MEITSGQGHSLSSLSVLILQALHALLGVDYLPLDEAALLFSYDKQRIPKNCFEMQMNQMLSKNSFVEVSGSQVELDCLL